ncbi:MAG: aspartate dehydrogenase [Candidatus Omnitrophica bacterium]|nr:aspartate dehydrogenase [Candidatus Omnitrophota bacterium]
MLKNKRVKIGIVGCGAIGSGVASYIDKKLILSAFVDALADKDIKAARDLQKKLRSAPKIYDTVALVKKVDLVIEAASGPAASFLLKKVIAYRKDLVIVSVGALIDKAFLLKEAAKRKINIYIPSGAILGIDGLGALSMGNIKKISLTTSKPPRGLIGADYLKKKRIDLTNLKKEKVVFTGSVKEAIKHFPKNINVAVAISLASAFKKVEVCIKADPRIKRNVHHIVVDSEEAKLSVRVENVPSKKNPKTSALAILSTQQLLKKIFSPFKIGS